MRSSRHTGSSRTATATGTAPAEAILNLDEDGRIETMNAAAERMFGKPATFFIDSNISVLLPDIDGVRELLKLTGSETVAQHGNGSKFRAAITVGSLRFIEERKYIVQIREADSPGKPAGPPRDGDENIHSMIGSATDAIVSIDVDGVITTMNSTAADLFGCSVADTVGHNISRLMPEMCRLRHEWQLENYFFRRRSGDLGDFPALSRETTAVKGDGKFIPLEVSINQVEISGDTHYTLILRDISARKKAEMEDVIRQSYDDACSKNDPVPSEYIGDLAPDMVDCLREPLQSIHKCASVLRAEFGDSLDSSAGFGLDYLVGVGTHIEKVLNDLLKFTMLDRSRPIIRKTDLNDVLAEVLDTLQPELRRDNIAVQVPAPCPC